MEVSEQYVPPALVTGMARPTKTWPREVLDAHYRSFKKVTVKQVLVGPDIDDVCWIVIEPSEIFYGLGLDRCFTAGTDKVPDLDVVQELLERGVEVTIEHLALEG